MRSGAPRRLAAHAIFLAAILVSAGCSSTTKKNYLHHLSITVHPADDGSELVASFDADRGIGAATASGSEDFPFESR